MEFTKQEVQEMKEAYYKAKALIKHYQRVISRDASILSSEDCSLLREYIRLNQQKVIVVSKILRTLPIGLS